ncbi:MAG: hypothetical protein LBE35_08885 [Clostridiales bacterium]|jgi:hypothetical protein|nr:hypothetical protein [Clostridiales bacterium]
MRKHSIFKRILAGGLAALFVLALLPPIWVSANPQNPVTNFGISSVTGGGRNYTLTMSWLQPATNPVTPAHTDTPAPILTADHFNILRFDAGPVGVQPNQLVTQVHNTQAPSFRHRITETNKPFGSIFGYRIEAVHYHPRPSVPPAPPPPPHRDAAMSPTVFFLTDLEVIARGEGRNLTIEWSRPLFNGQPAFTDYEIGVQLTAGGTRIPITVSTDPNNPTEGLTIPTAPGGRYVFETYVSQLEPGRFYDISVEPVINGATRHTPYPNNLAGAFAQLPDRGPLVYTMNLYAARSVFVRPLLRSDPVGMVYLLLQWDSPARPPVGQVEIIVESRPLVGPGRNLLANLVGDAAFSVDFLLIRRPEVATQFSLRVYVGGAPQEPIFHEFHPDLAQFTPTRPNINWVDTATEPTLGLEVNWDAFMRRPFTDRPFTDVEETAAAATGGWFRDPDVVYDVWITDYAGAFGGETVAHQFMVAEGMTQSQIRQFNFNDPDERLGNFTYNHAFTAFVDRNGVEHAIERNRVYYIRIVARRDVPGYQPSEAAYAAWFIPGDVLAQPPVMPRPPLRIGGEGLDYLVLEFEDLWIEAFRANAAGNGGEWHSAFGLLNNNLVFDYEVVQPNRWDVRPGVSPLFDLDNEAAIRLAMTNAGVTPPPLRTQDLRYDDMEFQFHLVPLIDILPYMANEAAFETFTRALHNNPAAWTTIDAEADDYGVFTHVIENLESDTAYGIFFRPVNAAGIPWWPTFLTGTTIIVGPPPDITPPAPFLSPYEYGDRWLEFVLRPFDTTGILSYEFWISEFADRSTAWQFDPNPLYERPFYYGANRPSADRRIFRADGLFPETNYYIWVKIYVTDNDERYNWSSPISMRTLPLIIPPPPTGLGLAGQTEVNIINLENERELRRIAPDHMIISWSPLRGFPNMPNDDNLPLSGIEAGAGNTEILGSELIDYVHMVLFPELVPNRGYWVRARTIFSVHRDGIGGEITERISYIVEFATNIDFVDATRVYVMPDASEIAPGIHTRMTISDWAGPLRFFTLRYDGEYDGDVIAELFPLPERDFEIIWNEVTRTLLWRFRSTGVDQWGHRDNLVDQRFISRLVQLRVFEHTIDMTNHNNIPVENRVIELPFSIIQAFNERGITLRIIAGDTTYVFSPGFANTPQNANFGRDSRVRLYISNLAQPEVLVSPRAYIVTPQSVGINVVNPRNMVTLTALGAPLYAIHSINRAVAMDYNIGAYMRTPDDIGWRRFGAPFNDSAGTITTSTTRLGHFAAIRAGLPTQFYQNPAARDALYFVNTQIAFSDMEWFMPDFPINAWQINRIISAIARNDAYVRMNDDLSAQERSSLINSRMLVPGADNVYREDALAGLVRLYEVRTGRRVSGQPTLETTAFPDIAEATPELQQALLRAEFLGFLDFETGQANPREPMSMGDAMQIFEIILRN